ncbi:MAG: TauD/TfdA dioxygenase family protein [Paracoccaceae bacterium]
MNPDHLLIAPIDGALGARVTGVDLRLIPSQTLVDRIESALEQYGVLVFPDQHITPTQQVAFSRAFAELEQTARIEARLKGEPDIFVVGNTGDKVVSFAPADGSDDLEWHADHMHLPVSARASMLYALEVPPAGGDTLFACMYGGFQALSPDEQAEAKGLTACHSGSGLRTFLREKGEAGTAEQVYAADADLVMRIPLVRRHPRSGRSALYFGSKVTIGIDGWEAERARDYLTALEAKATAPALRYAHKWAVGDAVLWDNRRVLHAGTPFDTERHRRCMHRTTFREDQPIA